MKMTNGKRGFTLIELLVVITIIGILATGATNVYTSQIQKARDSTRLTDMKALVSGVEQLYQDSGNYPNMGVAVTAFAAPAFVEVRKYTPSLPKDPRSNQKSDSSNFEYTYSVGSDASGIAFQTYEISIYFENLGNTESKSQNDGGNDRFRLEQGINIGTLRTMINRTGLGASWVSSETPAYLCDTQAATQTTTGNGAATTAGTCPTGGSIANPTLALIIR